MSDKKQINFNYNLLKGKIAEVIIEQLFQDLGFEVYPSGVEIRIPNYQNMLSNLEKSPNLLNSIRSLPDFVIHNPQLKIATLLEVKFRQVPCLEYENFYNYIHKDVLFIIVTLKGIKYTYSSIISRHFEETQEDFKNFKSFSDNEIFQFSEEQKLIIRRCEEVCNMVLGNLPKNNILVNNVINVSEPSTSYGEKE